MIGTINGLGLKDMATKPRNISIPEEKYTLLTELAQRLGYQSSGKGGIEKQLVNDILDVILENESKIHSESAIKEVLLKGIEHTYTIKTREPKRKNEAIKNLEGLIESYANEGVKKTKTYYNKNHGIGYAFLQEYEKDHPEVFALGKIESK